MSKFFIFFLASATISIAYFSCNSSSNQSSKPTLQCDPKTVAGAALCSCMANIVCDKIYFCLPTEGDRQEFRYPERIRTKEVCFSNLDEDCDGDLSNSDYQPSDYPACLKDLELRSCEEYGTFSNVSRDYPNSCKGLRALDTGLGVEINFLDAQ